MFAQTIEGEIFVHITPEGPVTDLYVAQKGKDYFVVKSISGKDVKEFNWLVSAYRKGYSHIRMEKGSIGNK